MELKVIYLNENFLLCELALEQDADGVWFCTFPERAFLIAEFNSFDQNFGSWPVATQWNILSHMPNWSAKEQYMLEQKCTDWTLILASDFRNSGSQYWHS